MTVGTVTILLSGLLGLSLIALLWLWQRLNRLTTNTQKQIKIFQTIADCDEAFITITTPDHVITYVNPACSTILGYNPDELIGSKPNLYRSNKTTVSTRDDIRQHLKAGQPWSGTLTNRRKSGDLIDLQTIISPVLSAEGTPLAYIAVSRDLTKEIDLENQLRHAQKMEAIGTLAGGIAHDFNNILSALIGYTELAMLDDENGLPVRGNLDQIQKAAQRATDLVARILTFSRRKASEKQALYLNPIVKESIKLLKGTLPASIEIHQSISDRTPIVLADATEMHQIIMNLCTNAAHAMRDDGGDLSIELFPHTIENSDNEALAPGIYAKLTIQDSGTGITPDVMTHIFDPYFTTKKGGEGTGLGLSTVHGIVKSHNGVITCESKPNEGATFSILLPACTDEHIREVIGNATATQVKGNHEEIMVVDDEESILLMVETSLKYLGFEISAFGRSPDALEAFTQEPDKYDAIITDQTMPTLNGTELAKRVRSIRPDIPIIICSGYSNFISEADKTNLGINEFLSKPVTGNKLAETLRRCMDESADQHANT